MKVKLRCDENSISEALGRGFGCTGSAVLCCSCEMLGCHKLLAIPLTGHSLLALSLTGVTILSHLTILPPFLNRAFQPDILPKEKEVVNQDLSSFLQLARQSLEGLVFKKAYADADRKSAWVDQVMERVRFLSEQGIPVGDIDQLLKKRTASLRLGKASIMNLDAAIKYYRSLNFQDVNMGRHLRKYPGSWYMDIEGYVKPKIEFFESIGFRGQDLEKLIVKEPRLLMVNLQTTRNVVEFLRTVALDQPSLCKMLRRCPQLLFYVKVEDVLKPRLEALRRGGFSREQLTHILVRRPHLLQYSVDESTLKKFDLFVEFGIKRDSKAFVSACVALLTLSNEQLRARFEFLLSLGFSHDDVVTLLRRQPGILARTEDGIGQRVAYAVNVMSRSLDSIVRCPTYLVISFEDRIKPRYEAFQRWKMQTAGKEYSLQILFTYSNDRFLKQFTGSDFVARASDGG